MSDIDIAQAEDEERRLAFYGLSRDADGMAEQATDDTAAAADEALLNEYGLTRGR